MRCKHNASNALRPRKQPERGLDATWYNKGFAAVAASGDPTYRTPTAAAGPGRRRPRKTRMAASDTHVQSLPVADGDGRLHLLGMTRPDLESWVTSLGQPKYRGAQLVDWIYAKGADSFAALTNLPKALRAQLHERAELYRSRVSAASVSTDGTCKLLLTWPDDRAVETVWIPEAERQTACISSQVGCPIGCRFCASGLGGLERQLTAGEIVEQALRVRQRIVAADAGRLSNIVLMGMGEPLANYEAVVAAIRIINAAWGLGIGARKITLSTVGLPRPIRRLADEGLPINLALSLHAPDDRLRRELIPAARFSINELLAACTYYFEKTGREVTLEYVLLDGVNMLERQATELVRLARRLRCNVNLLRYNPVAGLPFRRPSAAAAYEFQALLRRGGVNAHLRTSRGPDIAAACGQLRRQASEGPTPAPAGTTEMM